MHGKVKRYNGRPAPPAPGGVPPRHYRRPPLSPDLSPPSFFLSSFPLDTHLSSPLSLSRPSLSLQIHLAFRNASSSPRPERGAEHVATMRNLSSWGRTMRATLSLSSFSTAVVRRRRRCRCRLAPLSSRCINDSPIRYGFCNVRS